MNWKHAATALVCAAAMAFAGCGDDSGGGGGNNGGGSGVTGYKNFQTNSQDKLVNLLCTAVYDCPEKQSPFYAVFAGRFADKQACLDGAADLLDINTSDPETEAAIEAGRAEFNSAKANECLSAVDQMMASCPAVGALQTTIETGACAEIITPKQAEGDPCNGDDECVSGFCDYSSTSECYGTCAPAPQKAGAGESCDQLDCETGLICASEGQQSTSYVCIQPNSRQDGEACEFGMNMCADGLVCGTSGTCGQPPSYQSSGGDCDLSDTFCEPGTVCADLTQTASGASGTCSAPKAQGEDCRQTFQCQPGLYCDTSQSATGTCAALKAEGDACEDSEECSANLYCDSGQCADSSGQVCEIPSDTSGNNGGADAGMSPDSGPSADAGGM